MMKNAFFNRYGFRILIVVFFLLPLIGQGTNRTIKSNSNNVADWLPDHYKETNQYQWFLKNFPFERFVVVSWQGCTMDDPRVEMFAQKLVPGVTIDNIGRWAAEHFPSELVIEGESESDPVVPPPVQPDDVVPAAVNRAQPPPFFKDVLTGPRLVRMLTDMYSGEGIGGIKLSEETIYQKLQGILIGPDGHSTALLVTLTKEAPQGKELATVLEAIREIGRECGVHPQVPVDNRFFLLKAFDVVGTTVKEIIYGRTPEMSGVIIGGPPVDNVAITHEGEQTLQRLIGLCGLVGLTLAWLSFRDFRLTMFIFWMAIISAGVALASVSFSGIFLGSFGTCDAILLSMPALVYVLAMSGAIHLINYYHDAIREHGLDMAPERAVRHAMYPCFFANFTTALGLLSLCMSGLIPISKFGFYSALGIMLQLVLLFYYLPALLHFYPSHHIAAERTLNIEENSAMQTLWRVWSGFIIRNSTVVALICFAFMVFFGYGMTQIIPSVKMMRFFSSDSEIIHHYTWLEEHLGPLVPMEVVVEFDNEHCDLMTLYRLELVEKICNDLRTKLDDSVGGVMSAETMMPPSARFAKRTYAIRYAASTKLDKARGDLRDFIAVEGNLSFTGKDRMQNLAQLGISVEEADRLIGVGIDDVKKLVNTPADAELAGISSEELKDFREKAIQWEKEHGTDLWRISLRVWSLKKDIDYAGFIEDVKRVVEPVILVENAKNEDVNLFSFLPGDERTQNLEQMGISTEDADWLVDAKIDGIEKLITPPADTKLEEFSDEELKKFHVIREKAIQWVQEQVKDNTSIQAKYTGMVPVVYKTQHELYRGLWSSFISSFVMIGIVISFILRSPIAGFVAMIPNLFPVIIVFGFMGHFGVWVDIGTMMTASVALGIATDDTIHFLTWFRHGIDQGMSRPDATRYAYSRCATAMFQTTLIAGFGLAAFALSTFTPTQMFGVMMLAILLVAMLGDLIFLAAILNTPLGRVFEPRKKKS